MGHMGCAPSHAVEVSNTAIEVVLTHHPRMEENVAQDRPQKPKPAIFSLVQV